VANESCLMAALRFLGNDRHSYSGVWVLYDRLPPLGSPVGLMLRVTGRSLGRYPHKQGLLNIRVVREAAQSTEN